VSVCVCVSVCRSGMDSGRLSAGYQLPVSPGAYTGYSRTESFSSVGGEFYVAHFNIYLAFRYLVKEAFCYNTSLYTALP